MKKYRDVPDLSSELVTEILSRLPVKTIIRFTSVSKSWKSLIIHDPSFVKMHLSRSPKNTHIILSLEEDSMNVENKDTLVVPCSVRCLMEDPWSAIKGAGCYQLKYNYFIVGSCNGLVCLGYFCDDRKIKELWVWLWNPATNLRSKKSPPFRMKIKNSEYASWRKISYGFGYDHSRDTYKVSKNSKSNPFVVVVHWDRTKQKMETMVHYMGDIYWRNILSDHSSPNLLEQIEGQFVGGCVNWLALENVNGPNYQWVNVTLQQLVIASFDMSKEVYMYLPIPEGVSEVPHFEPNLGVLRNHMCFFHDHNKTHFVVWKMREYGIRGSWTRLVSVTYEHLKCDGILYRPLPLCLSEDGDIILLESTEDLEVIKYNIRDNIAEYIQIPINEVSLKADGYVPSLVSPFQDKEDGRD
ncbi:F-box/kelch-repeat protein At3g06240-like [Lotus japonicus]|uniref:F-box/kelch-repeat protein At3g06240-like n=1 Tax=Lotus japonicus TaxID=34305 RepID=UPI00258C5923|nr:F-box/kelch-repeat protein At3g06240-like [Lotus japonicus]